MQELQRELGMSMMIITHDLGVVAEVADFVAVMYASKVVEYATARDLYREPLHPYTLGLMNAIPKLDSDKTKKLNVIPGTVPDPLNFPPGCKFHPRCPQAVDRCKEVEPELRELRPGHWVACDVVS